MPILGITAMWWHMRQKYKVSFRQIKISNISRASGSIYKFLCNCRMKCCDEQLSQRKQNNQPKYLVNTNKRLIIISNNFVVELFRIKCYITHKTTSICIARFQNSYTECVFSHVTQKSTTLNTFSFQHRHDYIGVLKSETEISKEKNVRFIFDSLTTYSAVHRIQFFFSLPNIQRRKEIKIISNSSRRGCPLWTGWKKLAYRLHDKNILFVRIINAA